MSNILEKQSYPIKEKSFFITSIISLSAGLGVSSFVMEHGNKVYGVIFTIICITLFLLSKRVTKYLNNSQLMKSLDFFTFILLLISTSFYISELMYKL